MQRNDRVLVVSSHPEARSFVGQEGVIDGFKDDQVLVRLDGSKRTTPFWRDELELRSKIEQKRNT